MLAAGRAVCARLEVAVPMHGYGDLHTLAELPVLRFLVTSGFRRLQESKIKALGFERLFTAVYVDAIEEADRKGKQRTFEEILRVYQLRPEEVLVVGDNPDSEIEAGNRLGLRTVQVLRPGVPRGDNATHHIHDLADLKGLLKWGRAAGRIEVHFRPNNLRAHDRLIRAATRMLRRAGYPTVLIQRMGIETNSHQCGTTAAVNPALTIAAQALRVADHVQGRSVTAAIETPDLNRPGPDARRARAAYEGKRQPNLQASQS